MITRTHYIIWRKFKSLLVNVLFLNISLFKSDIISKSRYFIGIYENDNIIKPSKTLAIYRAMILNNSRFQMAIKR